MKFEYETPKDDRTVIAALYEFDGGPELCLAVKAQSGKTIWFYHNELLASVQNGELPTGAVKKFYPGGKLTITF